MKWNIERKTIIGLGLASTVVVTINAVYRISFNQYRETSAGALHNNQVLHYLKKTLVQLKDIEIEQQIYVITGKEQYLSPYYNEVVSIDRSIQELKRLTADNPHQQRRIVSLEPLIRQHLTVIKKIIDLRRQQGFLVTQKFIETNKEKNLIERVWLLVGEMEDEENKLLRERLEKEKKEAQRDNIFCVIGTIFNIFIFFLILLAIDGEIQKRKNIQAKLLKANEELERKVQQRTFDITQALETERELSLLKSQIVAIISHEYRTPLTTILSSAELLQHYGCKWSEEKKLSHFTRIQKTAQHMAKLVDDMLLLGKAETRQIQLNPSSLKLKQFCLDMIDQMIAGTSREISIEFEYQGIDNYAELDETLLRQILANLLSNAIKYSPSKCIVQLKVQCLDGIAQLWIKDFGIGIPEAELSKIFEFFYRASNVGTVSGTGLGLAIVKKCVDLHRGTIFVESILNQETTFTVTLPCIQTLSAWYK
ncbi:hypothetical protein NUACC21_29260 [Scytonema sp. NUACC21]